MARILSLFVSFVVIAPAWGRLPDGVKPQDDPNRHIGLSGRPQPKSALNDFYEGVGPFVTDITIIEGQTPFRSASLEDDGNTRTKDSKKPSAAK